jgi:hypothetical protein
MRRQFRAWAMGLLSASVVGTIVLAPASASAAPLEPVSTTVIRDVTDGLGNEDLGNDPDIKTNYNIEPIEDVGPPPPAPVPAPTPSEIRRDLC